MTDLRAILIIAARHLQGPKSTTRNEFSELGETYVADGGTWGQPFPYDELAHKIIPRCFIEEPAGVAFRQWAHEQDIDGLSQQLESANISHRLSEYALEVKLF